MKCPRCHVSLPKNTRFCPSCGLPVESLLAAASKKADAIPSAQANVRAKSDRPEQASRPTAKAAHLKDQVADADDAKQDVRDVTQDTDDKTASAMPEAKGAQNDASTADAQVASHGDDASSDDGGVSEGGRPDPDVQDTGAQGTENALDKVTSDAEAVDESAKRTPRLRVLATLAVVVCLVALVAWMVSSAQEAQRVAQLQTAEEALRTPMQVDVVLGVPNGEAAGDMPVALRVVGTTRTGDSVDEVFVVTLQEHELSLLPGGYDISLMGNAISSEGKVFSGSVESYKIEVALDDESERILSANGAENAKAEVDDTVDASAGKPVASFPIFVFGEIASAEVTDEEIDAVRAWMTQVGLDPQPYVNAVIARRAEATNRINAEATARLEEQLRAAEEVPGDVAQQPAAEQPAVEQPAAEQPAAEQPAAEQPAAEQPAAEQPAAEQPAAEQPVDVAAANAPAEG